MPHSIDPADGQMPEAVANDGFVTELAGKVTSFPGRIVTITSLARLMERHAPVCCFANEDASRDAEQDSQGDSDVDEQPVSVRLSVAPGTVRTQVVTRIERVAGEQR